MLAYIENPQFKLLSKDHKLKLNFGPICAMVRDLLLLLWSIIIHFIYNGMKY